MRPTNLLVISDLHLGEDLRSGERLPHLDALESELVDFLTHYAASEERWRLVINGDMVDFLSVVLRPEQVGRVVGWHEDDHYYGLGSAAEPSHTKMRAVVVRHARFFAALAAFVSAGNDIVVVAGNHDREFHWPRVQEAFRQGIAQYMSEDRDLLEAVSFHDWFYYEEGALWVEHGNQYDAYCSFDTVLDPVDPTEEILEENLGIVSLRYLGNQLPGNPEDRANLSFVDYIGMLFMRDTAFAGMLLSGYGTMIRKMFRQYLRRLFNPAAYEARLQRHGDRLKALAGRSGVSEEILEKLFAGRRRPIFVELSQLMRGLMLGRLLVTVLALGLVPLLFFMLPFWGWPWAGLAVVGSLVAAHIALAISRDDVDPSEQMAHAADRIRALAKTPIVVFGHSHHALARRLKNGWYFNTGTWVGEPDQMRVFTHLLVRRSRDGMRAALCRWRNGRSRELRAEKA